LKASDRLPEMMFGWRDRRRGAQGAREARRQTRCLKMKRIVTLAAILSVGIALGVLASQFPAARALFGRWTAPPRLETKLSIGAAPAPTAADAAAPDGGKEPIAEPAQGVIDMPPHMIEAQGIEVAAVGKGVLTRGLTLPGVITLDANKVARVPGRVVGTVTQMRKRLGDLVAQGEVVAVLDSREIADAKSEYLTALVAFDLQKTMYERAQSLWAKKISSEQQYLQARATYLETELRLDLSRQKLTALNLDVDEVVKAAKDHVGASTLREYEIRSLIAGRVIERKVDVGSLIGSQGDPAELYTVADLSTVWAELAASTADLDMIEEGQNVVIAGGGEGGKQGEGKIIFISPLVHPETRSARVIARIDNKSLIWRPGSVVTARIMIKEEPVDLLVARAALQTIGGAHAVFIRTADGFQERAVTVGRSDERAVEITSGLSPGQRIAVKNTFLLKAELGKGDVEFAD
jgi:cobalt-zinc-cadmium efflux system membrane fusion protein